MEETSPSCYISRSETRPTACPDSLPPTDDAVDRTRDQFDTFWETFGVGDELMARRELDRQAYQAAALHIGDLPEPRPELEARLRQLGEQLERRDEEYEQLQRVRRAVDVDIGRSSRSIFVLLMGVIWGMLALTSPVVLQGGGPPRSSVSAIVYISVAIVIFALGLFVGRRKLLRNRANWRMLQALLALLVGNLAFRALGWASGMPRTDVLSFECALTAVGASMLALTMDRRVFWGALPYAVATFLVPTLSLSAATIVFGGTHIVATSLLAWAWWPKKGG